MTRSLTSLVVLFSWPLIAVDAVAILQRPSHPPSQQPIHKPLSLPLRNLTLPIYDPVPSRRADEVERNRMGYLYGQSLIGNSSYFPSGILGKQLVGEHLDSWYADATRVVDVTANESEAVMESLAQASTPVDLI